MVRLGVSETEIVMLERLDWDLHSSWKLESDSSLSRSSAHTAVITFLRLSMSLTFAYVGRLRLYCIDEVKLFLAFGRLLTAQ